MTDEILIYVAFGSNLGDRVTHLATAATALGRMFRPVAFSGVYGTAPRYVTDQPPFLNAVASYACRLSPHAVLAQLQAIEQQQGRVRTVRHGPRTLDLDLLAYGEQILDTPELTLPHQGIAERAFVLMPWQDIAPDWQHPQTGRTVSNMLAALDDVQDVVRDAAASASLATVQGGLIKRA